MLKNGERPLNSEEREFFYGLYKGQCPDYATVLEKMKELLTAKANIDRILGMDAPDRTVQRERPSEQR